MVIFGSSRHARGVGVRKKPPRSRDSPRSWASCSVAITAQPTLSTRFAPSNREPMAKASGAAILSFWYGKIRQCSCPCSLQTISPGRSSMSGPSGWLIKITSGVSPAPTRISTAAGILSAAATVDIEHNGINATMTLTH